MEKQTEIDKKIFSLYKKADKENSIIVSSMMTIKRLKLTNLLNIVILTTIYMVIIIPKLSKPLELVV